MYWLCLSIVRSQWQSFPHDLYHSDVFHPPERSWDQMRYKVTPVHGCKPLNITSRLLWVELGSCLIIYVEFCIFSKQQWKLEIGHLPVCQTISLILNPNPPLSGDLLDVKEVISCAVIPSFTSRWEQTLNVIQVHFNVTERFSRMSSEFRILKEVQFISL